jgi:hypothetical protein
MTGAHGGDGVSAQMNSAEQKIYPLELKAILERARAGDKTVLPELKKAYDEHPELPSKFGDLVVHAEEALLSLAAGNCLMTKEAMRHQLAVRRAELATDVSSSLEELLADRAVLCWLGVQASELFLADHLRELPSDSPAVRAAQQRLDAAHRRFLTAVKCLAQVKKLLRPALSPVEMLSRSVPETTTNTSSHSRGPSRFVDRQVLIVN